jgi:ATP-dependent Zn protease
MFVPSTTLRTNQYETVSLNSFLNHLANSTPETVLFERVNISSNNVATITVAGRTQIIKVVLPKDHRDIIERLVDCAVPVFLSETTPLTIWSFTGATVAGQALNVVMQVIVFRILSSNITDSDISIGFRLATFKEVIGLDMQKRALLDAYDYIMNAALLEKMGLKQRNAILLYGEPGNGKTLLCRALAGEKGIKFIYAETARLANKYVGSGPNRVHEIFEEARRAAPCILFFDEIDTVGSRIDASNGAERESNNLINQLLMEIDGGKSNDGVILVFATNRPDTLDPALVRAGRISNKIHVTPPKYADRLRIICSKFESFAAYANVDYERLARNTASHSRANIVSICENAFQYALHKSNLQISRTVITDDDVDEAIKSNYLGEITEECSTELDLTRTVYHELGHAYLTDYYCKKGILPGIYCISVETRSQVLGVVIPEPQEGHSPTVQEIKARIDVACAGRVAEEIFTHGVTSGCSSDIKIMSDLAHTIAVFGGDEKYGMRHLPVFHHQYHASTLMAEHQKNDLYTAVKQILDDSFARVKALLSDPDVQQTIHKAYPILKSMHYLTGPQITSIFNGHTPSTALRPLIYERVLVY